VRADRPENRWEPLAERGYAVEPVGVERMRPSEL
jgi:hypothetical protein